MALAFRRKRARAYAARPSTHAAPDTHNNPQGPWPITRQPLRANQRVLAVVAAAASAAVVALVAKSKKWTGNGRDDVSSL